MVSEREGGIWSDVENFGVMRFCALFMDHLAYKGSRPGTTLLVLGTGKEPRTLCVLCVP